MGLHLHEMRDTDKHFIIDPVTRSITNPDASKNKLIQFDHNSEIFTFEIPQYVDGHDMNQCDKVEVHYINIDGKTKEQSKDLFPCKAAAKTDDDLVFNIEDGKLLFCWKVSGNATKYAGSLNFLICFSCLDDEGNYTYKWHTDIFKGLNVSDGLSNTEVVEETYSDVLEQWKKELEDIAGSGSGDGGSYVINVIDNGDDTFRADKTFAQISEAIASGKEAICVFGAYHYQLVSYTENKIVFTVSECDSAISYKTFTFDNTNGDSEIIYKFEMPPYQYQIDGNLETDDITVVGAINEVNAKVNSVINNGTVISENADYAEVGEWSDGNPDAEDRTGYFVSVDTSEPGKTMVKATSTSDVRGVVMKQPAFAANASKDKYDTKGNLLAQYGYVCFAGFAPVIDNGTCTVNGRCMPADDGTAIPSTNNMGYQVIERIDDTHVLVLVEPQADMMVRIKEDVSQLSEEIVELKQNGTGTIVSNIEPLDDDIPKVYFTGTLPTSKGEGSVPVTIRYVSKTMNFVYPATLGVQGSSSANYAKKNFTLKLYNDETHESKVKIAFKNWGKLNKFVLKAHWIDHSHVRNVGTAKIWGKIVESRSDYASLPEELRASPNNGATDGFTVKVFANGVYQGLYEWIVPKDKLFGQDPDVAMHSILNSELNNQATCAFATTSPTISGNWSEELQDTLSSDISDSFANVIKFVAGSTDEEFITNAENYFDVQSVIDYDIFARVFCIVDNLCRNQIFFTYDGIKWYEGVWDLDAILGLPPTTRGFFAYDTEFQSGYIAYKDYGVTNLLYNRVENLFMRRFKTRYTELRADVLSIENILDVYERLTDVIKTYDGLLEEDYASTTGGGEFTGIPYTSENNIQQIRSFVAQRIPYMDEVINSMTEPVHCTGIMLNTDSLTFTDEKSQTLTAIIEPDDCTDAIIWESSDIGIAMVSNGIVTPIANGNCTITVICGDYSADCEVDISGIVDRVPCTEITLDYSELTLKTVGETEALVATVIPENTTDIITWSSNNETIATVENGVITSVGSGECTVTAICGAYSATCKVCVIGNLLDGFVFSLAFINYNTGAYSIYTKDINVASPSYAPVKAGTTYVANVTGVVTNPESELCVGIKYYTSDKTYTNVYIDDAEAYIPYTFTVPDDIDASYIRLGFVVRKESTDTTADWSNAVYTLYEV